MSEAKILPGASAVPTAVPGFQLEELDGDLLLFNVEDNRLLELNATAALVWQLCDGARSVGAIIALLIDAYPDAGQAVAADVPEILGDLRAMGAVSW